MYKRQGKLNLPLVPTKKRALLHGHCHQKSFDTMAEVTATLKLIPGLHVAPIESNCCGMAGAFGYHADTIDVSRAMGELSLLPAVRKAPDDAIIVADLSLIHICQEQDAGRNILAVINVCRSQRRRLNVD